MGLRCLIGHDFGDPLTERDREERGDEVVVTITEYKECTRCGHRQVLSENTEVRSAEPDSPPDPASGPAADSRDPEEFEDVSAEEDDGIILEDEDGDSPGRERGEWPETEEPPEPSEEPAEWPEVEGRDEGFDAEPGDGEPADVEFRGGGLEPEAADPPPEDADDIIEAEEHEPAGPPDGDAPDPAESGGDEAADDITSAAPGPTPTQRQRPDAVETEFVCPECGYTADTDGSSLRPGDICPECRRGYLDEREA